MFTLVYLWLQRRLARTGFVTVTGKASAAPPGLAAWRFQAVPVRRCHQAVSEIGSRPSATRPEKRVLSFGRERMELGRMCVSQEPFESGLAIEAGATRSFQGLFGRG